MGPFGVKCFPVKRKNKATSKLYQNDEEIELQLLKNWVHSSRKSEIQIEAEVEFEVGDVGKANLDECKYLWEKEQKEWVVLKDEYDYTVFNINIIKPALLIEDDDLDNHVAEMMILQGNRVIDGKEAIEKVLKG